MRFHSLIMAAMASVAAAKEVTGVFTDITSVVPQDPKQSPSALWTTTLDWKIDGSQVSPGDTFHLTIPGIFLFAAKSLDLRVGNDVYAQCTLSGGTSTDGTLACTATDKVTAKTDIYGQAWFQVFLCQGFAFDAGDLKCLSYWKGGENTWTFNDGANDYSYTFEITAYYDGDKAQGKRGILNIVRTGVCSAGYDAASIQAEIGDGLVDCSTVKVTFSKGVNDWNAPVTNEGSSISPYQVSCQNGQVKVTLGDIPAGYTPYLTFNDDGTGKNFTYGDTFKCKDSTETKTETWLKYYPGTDISGTADADGYAIERTTTGWTGSIILTTTEPYPTSSGVTKTIVVLTPLPTSSSQAPTSSEELSLSEQPSSTSESSSFSEQPLSTTEAPLSSSVESLSSSSLIVLSNPWVNSSSTVESTTSSETPIKSSETKVPSLTEESSVESSTAAEPSSSLTEAKPSPSLTEAEPSSSLFEAEPSTAEEPSSSAEITLSKAQPSSSAITLSKVEPSSSAEPSLTSEVVVPPEIVTTKTTTTITKECPVCEEKTTTVEVPCVVETTTNEQGPVTTTKEVENKVTTTVTCHEEKCETKETTVWIVTPPTKESPEESSEAKPTTEKENPQPQPTVTKTVPHPQAETSTATEGPNKPVPTEGKPEANPKPEASSAPKPQPETKLAPEAAKPEETKPATQPEVQSQAPAPEVAPQLPIPEVIPQLAAPEVAPQPNQTLESEQRTAEAPQSPQSSLLITIPTAGPTVAGATGAAPTGATPSAGAIQFEGAGSMLTVPSMMLALMLAVLFV